MKTVSFYDLFAGIGGMRIGFEKGCKKLNIKTKCIGSCDNKKSAVDVYNQIFKTSEHPKNVEDIKIKDLPNFDYLLAGFPCFVSGTQVLTEHGYKKIEDVDQKDKLLTHTGTFQRIRNKQQKTCNNYLIDLDIEYLSNNIHCTSEHPFYARTKENPTRVWIEAQNLTDEHYVGFPINQQSRIPTTTIGDTEIKLDNPDEWYFIGCYLGNGHLIVDKNKTRIIINNHIKNKTKIYQRTKKMENPDNYLRWAYFLKNNFSKSIDNKIIPEWVQEAPREFLSQLIEGYIDSQQYLEETPVILPNIARDMQRICAKCNKLFTITYTYTQTEKMDNYFIDDNYMWFQVKSAKTMLIDDNMTVYNFEVENDNSYIVENVVVHNCQPFSTAGKRRGFEDKRGNMFYYVLDFIEEKTPKGFILENVSNLLIHDDGNTFLTIKNLLEEAGYHIQTQLLNSANFGVPQKRERTFIIGRRDDQTPPPDLAKIIEKKMEEYTASTIADIIDNDDKKYINSKFTKALLNNYEAVTLWGKSVKDKRGGESNIHSWDIGYYGEVSDIDKQILEKILLERRKKKWAAEKGIKWMDGMPLTCEEIKTFCDIDNLATKLESILEKGYLVKEYPRDLENGKRVPQKNLKIGYNINKGKLSFPISKFLHPNEIAPTLTATDCGRLGLSFKDPDGIRLLNIKECLGLSGFSQDLQITCEIKKFYDLIGNTVCPPVMEAITTLALA